MDLLARCPDCKAASGEPCTSLVDAHTRLHPEPHRIRVYASEIERLHQRLAHDSERKALAILNEAMGDIACIDWPDDARTYIARAAAALKETLDKTQE